MVFRFCPISCRNLLFKLGTGQSGFPRHIVGEEDPDLICRVPSAASEYNNDSHWQEKVIPRESLYIPNASKFKLEEDCLDANINDPLRMLSTFSGAEDPYTLLRELQILPSANEDRAVTNNDNSESSSFQNQNLIDQMIGCLEGRPKYSKNFTNHKKRIKNADLESVETTKGINQKGFYFCCDGSKYVNSSLSEADDDISRNEKSFRIQYHQAVSYHSPLCIVIVFILQNLPILILAIMHVTQNTRLNSASAIYGARNSTELDIQTEKE